MANRSSGLDFSDKRATMDALAAHPDVVPRTKNGANLQRNKTERHRLQGLMRTVSNNNSDDGSTGSKSSSKNQDVKLMDRWHTWLINGGRSKIIFAAYIFLHVIVFVMGFLHYQLKDNSSGVRSLVGLGFGEPTVPRDCGRATLIYTWQHSLVRPLWSCT